MVDVLAIGLFLALALMLLPGCIASARKAQHAAGVWALSLIAGWTGVGWIAAFVWACVSPARKPAKRRGWNKQKKTIR
jgi:hypothetical protein